MGETRQTTDPLEAKRLARLEARLAMEGLSLGQAAEDSQAVCRLILESAVWKEVGQAMLYMPISGELDVIPLMKIGLEIGKSIALPRFSAKKIGAPGPSLPMVL